jgi:RimJ/RimL family protein N-acetyltransferase
MLVSVEKDPRGSGIIWTLDLAAPTPNVPPTIPAAFRRIKLEGLPELSKATGEVVENEFQKRLESGRRCYTAWTGGRMGAYGWVSLEEEWIGELRLHLRLSPGEAYIWDCFTLPAFRQKYLYTALLSYIIASLRLEQLRRVWIGTNADNLASQRGIARAGFQPVGVISAERALAMRMVWVQGFSGAPESLVAEARRVFLNDRDRVWLEAPAAAASYWS